MMKVKLFVPNVIIFQLLDGVSVAEGHSPFFSRGLRQIDDGLCDRCQPDGNCLIERIPAGQLTCGPYFCLR